MKIYLVWQISNDTHQVAGIYDNLKMAKKRMDEIKNDWPAPSIHSMEVNETRKEPDWGEWVA